MSWPLSVYPKTWGFLRRFGLRVRQQPCVIPACAKVLGPNLGPRSVYGRSADLFRLRPGRPQMVHKPIQAPLICVIAQAELDEAADRCRRSTLCQRADTPTIDCVSAQ